MGSTWDITEQFTAEMNYWSVKFQDLINQEGAQTTSTSNIYESRGRVYRRGVNWGFAGL